MDGSYVSPADIEKTVGRLMREARVQGLGVAILNQGSVMYLRGFGYRDVARHKPLTEDTVMAGCSFSKTVFAYMVMQLVEENVLDLDRPVFKYLPKPLPEYRNYRDLSTDDRYKKITARMILDHSTGFPNWRRFTEDGRLAIFFEPGTRFAYSGEGIDLLGLVVEEVTRADLGKLMQRRVFAPLHMRRTSMTWQPAFESNYAIGYDEKGGPLGHNQRKHPDAAGSMDTTISDFAPFAQALLERRGLGAQTWQTMLSPQIRIHSQQEFPTLSQETTAQNDGIQLSYGLGLGIFQTPYGKAYFKEGRDDGWENHFVAFDHNQTALVLMSNSSTADGTFKELLSFLIGDTFTPWEWEGYIPYNRRDQKAADVASAQPLQQV